MILRINVCILFLVITLSGSAYSHEILSVGRKRISLLDSSGQSVSIGHLLLSADKSSKTFSYELVIDYSDFKDYFLSMKEMKCLEGPELWCHLEYPYSNPATITEHDFSWLSHDLLFMFKKPNEFGANFWNGIYYEFSSKNGVITGTAQAVDLNLLASPPDDLTIPPFSSQYDRYDLEDTSARWLPRMIIN